MSIIEQLHNAWCSASGQELNRMATERIFYAAAQMGFLASDITLVVNHMIRFNKKSGGAKFRINAFKVLGDLETFASMVAEVKALEKNRRPTPTPKQEIVEAFRPTIAPEESDSRIKKNGCHISDVMKQLSKQ